MSLLRIPFILSGALAMHIAVTPPNPPPAEDEAVLEYSNSEYFAAKTFPLAPIVAKVTFWIWSLLELAVIMVGANLPSPLPPNLVISVLVWSSHPASAISRIRITPLFLTGWLLIVTGGLIRFLCYRALGSLFTFELSIRKDHKLITSGPYSIVRHPSYSGSIMIVLGYTICYLSSGSWLTECSGLSLDGTVGRLLVSGWVTSVVCGISSFFPRMKKEDDMLRVKFRDWNEWAKKVPYKLIPLVY